MPHPLQCLLLCKHASGKHFVLAASGSYIYVIDASNGDRVERWPAADIKRVSGAPKESEPPTKRPKLSPEGSESSSAEIVTEQTDPLEPPNPPVVKLAASSDGRYVIAVTGEDKCVRVFALAPEGTLNLFSARCMPKRPCAIALTPDESTLLCADKFGDVYAMPLLGQEQEAPDSAVAEDGDKPGKVADEQSDIFIPSASSLTVHTKRNLESLRQQQKQLKKKSQKKATTFEHRIVLGHVSLLTDLACATHHSKTGALRHYILTSDRDEHIRVSRGLPQAHIIEGYCLGHSQFVSRICLIPSRPRLLLSGGGDDFLLLWDWPLGIVKQQIDIKGYVEQARQSCSNSMPAHVGSSLASARHMDNVQDHLAVNYIEFLKVSDEGTGFCGEVFIGIEGVPAILQFRMTVAGNLEYCMTHTHDTSVDTLHLPFSTTVIYDEPHSESRGSVGVIKSTISPASTNQFVHTEKLMSALDTCASRQGIPDQKNVAKGRSVQELLYGLESLRKRANEEAGED